MGAFCVTQRSFCFDFAVFEADSDSDFDGNPLSSFILEVIFTFALCNTVLHTGTSNDCPNQYFGFAIGLTVTGGAMACGGYDQGSFNPAVTIGINMGDLANGSRNDSDQRSRELNSSM